MSFASDIRKFAEKAKRGYHEVATESLISLSASVIVKTPVDEGTLANSWRATTSSPSTSIQPYASPASQMSAIEDKLDFTLGHKGIYYLVNNQPYVRPIEFLGYSEKAPAGMLRVSIENYQKFIDNAIDKL